MPIWFKTRPLLRRLFPPQTVELFAGTRSFSDVAVERGYRTFTTDIDPEFACTLTADICSVRASALPQRPFMLWASPPCEGFSVAAIGKNWNRDGSPRHARALLGQQLVVHAIELIDATQPRWWFIENPRGMLRKMPFMSPFLRHTITYCQYGDLRQKPTDIWTNASWFKARPMCAPNAGCHFAAPRGSSSGTQGLATYERRSRVPLQLFRDIFDQAEAHG